jgi:succinate dehydrogenase hydrophobic anchor subunit
VATAAQDGMEYSMKDSVKNGMFTQITALLRALTVIRHHVFIKTRSITYEITLNRLENCPFSVQCRHLVFQK